MGASYPSVLLILLTKKRSTLIRSLHCIAASHKRCPEAVDGHLPVPTTNSSASHQPVPLVLFLAPRVVIYGMEGCSLGGAVLNLLQR